MTNFKPEDLNENHAAALKQLYIRAEVVELGPISVEVPRDPDDAPILATLAATKAVAISFHFLRNES